jgi:glucose-1-phosphate thymidylyltransferase
VAGWYDAGAPNTLLATNRVLLEKGRARRPKGLKHCTIVEPVYIEDGVTCTGSTIGPNVSISAGSSVLGSTLTDTIVGANTRIERSSLASSLIGDQVTVEEFSGTLWLGDHGEVRGTS